MVNVLIFYAIYILHLKARARFASMLSNEFPIKRGVRQGCPLSPILFNLFINDILNDCEKYGVSIGRKNVLMDSLLMMLFLSKCKKFRKIIKKGT